MDSSSDSDSAGDSASVSVNNKKSSNGALYTFTKNGEGTVLQKLIQF